MSDDEWRTFGSDYLWRRIRRSVVEGGLVVGFSDGSVVGYLPKEESDYEAATTGEPAPLWHGKPLAWSTFSRALPQSHKRSQIVLI